MPLNPTQVRVNICESFQKFESHQFLTKKMCRFFIPNLKHNQGRGGGAGHPLSRFFEKNVVTICNRKIRDFGMA